MPEIDEKTMVAYLLGDLSEEEQALAATQLFTEPRYQQLQIIEEELIEDYARSELSRDERDHFEKFFLAAPHRRERVEFARSLLDALAEREAEEREPAQPASISWRQSPLFFLRSNISLSKAALASVSLIAFIGGAVLIYENRRLRGEAESLRVNLGAERDSWRQQEQLLRQHLADQLARNEQLAADLERETQPPTPPAPSSTFAFTLNALLVKGAEGSRIAIPPSARLLRIRLELDRAESYRGYRVGLRKAEVQGLRHIASRHARPIASGRVVIAILPVGLFTTGDYILTLKGVTASGAFEDVADYQFSIVKK